MFVPSVMGAPLLWAGASPVLVYNLLIIAGLALSGWSMYLLMRRWTGSDVGGDHRRAGLRVQRARADALRAPAGAPRRVLSARAVCVRSRPRRAAAVAMSLLLAAAFVLQALCSNYLLVFTTYALLVVGSRALAGARRPQEPELLHRRHASHRRPSRAVPLAVLRGQPRSGPGAPRRATSRSTTPAGAITSPPAAACTTRGGASGFSKAERRSSPA